MPYSFLHQLLTTPSISGFEDKCSRIFYDAVKPIVSNVEIDGLYNVIASIKGYGTMPICIEAHIDEVGFQVVSIDTGGFIRIRSNGAVDVQCLFGLQLDIFTSSGEVVKGIVGKLPIHMSYGDVSSIMKLCDIYIDTGMDVEELKTKVRIGDPVVVSPNPFFVGTRFFARGLDNKAGVFVLYKVLQLVASEQRIPKNTLIGLASTQEEIGGLGANMAVYAIKPKIAIVIDTDLATDYPGCNISEYGDIKLGYGTVISRHLDSDRTLINKAIEIAEKYQISYQLSAGYRAVGGTNANGIKCINGGTKTLYIGIPCRYMHTPVENIDLRDVEATIQLIMALIEEL